MLFFGTRLKVPSAQASIPFLSCSLQAPSTLQCQFSAGVRSAAKSVIKAKSPTKKVTSPTRKPIVPKPSYYEPTATRLAKKASPTLLYQASSNLPYIIGCYVAGGGLIAMGAFNAYTNFSVPKSELGHGRNVPRYVPFFVNIGSLFMITIGCYFCLRVCCLQE